MNGYFSAQQLTLKETSVCVLPGSRESADPGEEHRWLHINMDSQRQLPVVTLHFACSARVFKVQHCFQSLQKDKKMKGVH